MTSQLVRTWSAFLLGSLLVFPLPSFPAVSPARRAQARTAYERAVRLRTALETQRQNSRRKADYEKAIRAFQSVYRLSPAYSKAPVALAAVAEMQQEMGHVFSSDRYFLDSVRAYEFLIAQYPQSSIARDALFTIGEIYRTDLENPEEAGKVFRKFLEQYPKSTKAAEAREKLKQIDRLLADRAASRNASLRTAGAGRPGTGEPDAGRVPEVTAVRRWVGSNYSRIVVTVDGEVKFDASRVANPDRIVFDLLNSRLSQAMAGKSFPIEDGYLREIRVAQYRPNVTRVVLDVKEIDSYSVFTLPNPFRLVIDIHGAPPAEPPSIAKASPQTKTTSETAGSPRANTKRPAAPAPPARGQRPAAKESRPGAVTETPTTSEPAETTPPRAAQAEPKERASLKPPVLPPLKSSTSESTSPKPREVPVAVKPAAPTEAGSRTLTRVLGLKIGRLVIDPGHGGHDTGTIGPTGLAEKDLVLDVAQRLKELLEKKTESEVILTRSDDTFIPLEERTAIANEKASDLFISIHANASRDTSARGIETYYLNFTSNPDALEVAARENATTQESVHELQDLIKKIALTEKIEESHEFAKQVQRQVHATLAKSGSQQRDRGVKKAPFAVLIGANMPSVLAEISFLTNPRDERLLKRPEYRQKIAEALYQGISQYMNGLSRVKVAQQLAAQDSPQADPPNF